MTRIRIGVDRKNTNICRFLPHAMVGYESDIGTRMRIDWVGASTQVWVEEIVESKNWSKNVHVLICCFPGQNCSGDQDEDGWTGWE